MRLVQALAVHRRLVQARLKALWALRKSVEVPEDVRRRLDEAVGTDDGGAATKRLAERFALTPHEVDLWTTLACLQVFPDLGVQLGELEGRWGRVTPTVSVLALLVRDAHLAPTVLAALAPDERMATLGLVTLGGSDEAPLSDREVFIDEHLLRAVAGTRRLPGELEGYSARVARPRPPVIQLPAATSEAVAAGLEAHHLSTVFLASVDFQSCVGLTVALSGRPALALDLRGSAQPGERQRRLRAAMRESLLQRELLVVALADPPGSSDDGEHATADRVATERWDAERVHLLRALERFPAPCVLVSSGLSGRAAGQAGLARPVLRLEVPAASREQQVQAWEHGIAALGGEPGWAGVLAGRFPLSLGGIHGLCDQAGEHVAAGGSVSEGLLQGLARQRLGAETGQLARAVTTRLSWEDLVLPGDLKEQVREIATYARHRDTVMETYNMRRWGGAGLHVLLAGEPGTGKTTLAMLLAKELGRETLQVNLDQVFSKYVGETEKHLVRLFALAEQSRALLLLDEADALLANRTDVKGANDRFGNLAVNVVLQLMEQYEVLSVATTNREEGLDAASLRRFAFRFTIPPPDPLARGELFRRMLPRGVSVDADVDWDWFGQQVEITGGQIRNVMQRAAALAAANGDRLTNALVAKAINRELAQLGRLLLRLE